MKELGFEVLNAPRDLFALMFQDIIKYFRKMKK